MLGLPELINGVLVEPLTLRRLSWLVIGRSPFVTGAEVTPDSLIHFVWTVAKDWKLSASAEERKAYAVPFLAMNESELCEGIEAYMERAFLDSPPSAEGVSYYAPAAGLYHTLNEYFPGGGWTMPAVLDAPLRMLYQLIKCADKHKGATVINRRSYAVKGRMLDTVESWEVDSESEIDPLIESKREEGFGLFSQPIKRGEKWLVTMRRISNAE